MAPRARTAEPVEEEEALDLTVYADKEPTHTMLHFAKWIVDEVFEGEYPGNLEDFEDGVRLGGTLRMIFQASDYWKTESARHKAERAAERETARAARAEAAAAAEPEAEEAPKPARRGKAATAVTSTSSTTKAPARRGKAAAPAADAEAPAPKPARRGRAAAPATAPF